MSGGKTNAEIQRERDAMAVISRAGKVNWLDLAVIGFEEAGNLRSATTPMTNERLLFIAEKMRMAALYIPAGYELAAAPPGAGGEGGAGDGGAPCA